MNADALPTAVRHRLDPESERIALYVRLTSVLRRRIETGEWGEGHRIPSIEELCEEYGVARNTVRQALQLLKSDGLIDGGRGVGTFVLKSPGGRVANNELKEAISDPLHLGADQSIEILARNKKVQLPEALCGERGAYPDYTQVRKIHRFRGQPFALMDIYIAAQVYAKFPKGQDGSTKIARLLRDSGVRIADSRLEITTRHPDHETARLLEYSMTGSLVCMRRWRTDADNRIVTAGTYLYRGDLFVLDIAEPFAGIGPARTDFVPRVRKKPR
ncbi:GntR family transcriptional regulator [Rhodoplanes sp. Z2-YC6860]|uniref:GntR family transcriptional regulator n=1 Tax=Rhodoplanes sp. Z2-YC6860 TaxID=674703 RepID=UPI00078CD8F0|nr:GntR family transcriptional regulator [Rhodoplanes sp. Z2-YC6860]AMN39876.1 GntR family transcriptional regulator [Rhodoplanes sp. Z2-YC6860]